MTSLSAARTRGYTQSQTNALPISTSTTIWGGAAVGIDRTTGLAGPMQTGYLFVGFAKSSVNHIPGQQRDNFVTVLDCGQVVLEVSGAVQADVGKDVYATDDGTFVVTSAGGSFVGVAKQFVASGKLLVEMAPPSMMNSLRLSADGTAVVSGDGSSFPILTSNDGTRDILRLDAGSWLQLGVSAQGAGKELVNLTETNTNDTSVARPTLVYVNQNVAPADSGTYDFHGVDALTKGGGANANFSANTGFYAVEGKTQFDATAGQTMGKTVGVFGSSMMTGSSGTLSLSVGVQGETQQTGAGTTTAAAAFYARTPTITAGTIATAYGMFMQDIVGATNNFAIQTNAGRILFHSNVAPPAGGAFKVGVMMSSTNAFGIYFGSGAPTLSAAQGSIYMRTDGSSTSTRMYVNTNGTTGWTAVTTAT